MRTKLTAVATGLLLLNGSSSWLPATAAPASSVDAEATSLLPPPTLTDPITTTVHAGHTTLKLTAGRDHVVQIAPGAVLTQGLVVVGGRNVVVRPGTLSYAPPPGATPAWRVRGLYLKGQTGVVHVSGLRIRGPLKEGINLDQRAPRATVVLRDIDIDLVVGSQTGHHADVLQTWAGPWRLVVDGLRGASNYQGFFLKPNQEFTGPRPKWFWLRGVTLDMRTGFYALWSDGGSSYPVQVRTTTVTRNPTRMSRDQWLWPKPSTGDTTWQAVTGA